MERLQFRRSVDLPKGIVTRGFEPGELARQSELGHEPPGRPSTGPLSRGLQSGPFELAFELAEEIDTEDGVRQPSRGGIVEVAERLRNRGNEVGGQMPTDDIDPDGAK